MRKYYEDEKYNAAFDRCVDVMAQMLQKYGHQVLNRLDQEALQTNGGAEEETKERPIVIRAA